MKFVVVALALALSCGCRPKTAPTPAPPTSDVVAAPLMTVAPDPVDTGNANGQDVAAACFDDQSCSGYLRCEQGRCVVPPAVDGRIVDGMPSAVFVDGDRELATIMLEIADDQAERNRGLMFRRKMHPDFGMLFIFDGDALRSFWMKNTLIPLDMVHIDSRGRVVGVVERAEPMTLSPRETGEPARYVLELVAGRAAELGIKAGVKMKVDGLPPELAPRE